MPLPYIRWSMWANGHPFPAGFAVGFAVGFASDLAAGFGFTAGSAVDSAFGFTAGLVAVLRVGPRRSEGSSQALTALAFAGG